MSEQERSSDPYLRHRLDEIIPAHLQPDEAQWRNTPYVSKMEYDAQASRISALETEVEQLRAKLAGWLVAVCKNCDQTIAQIEPRIWIHIYGPMIGRGQCNQLHGAESDHAEPDDRYHERVRYALTPESVSETEEASSE